VFPDISLKVEIGVEGGEKLLRDMVTPLGVNLISVAVVVVVTAESWSAAIHQLQCSHAAATSIDMVLTRPRSAITR
jgi:hypothetical protein